MRLSPADQARADYLMLCSELMEHAKLMRDYATTPGNIWLARSELNKIMALATELERLMDTIKQAEV